MWKWIFTSILILLASCSAPDPTPELKDPIYIDLTAKISEIEKAIENERTNKETEIKNLRTLDIQSAERARVSRKIDDIQIRIQKLEQEKRFLRARISSRKIQLREMAVKTFIKNEEFKPNSIKDDYSAYSRLRNSSLKYSQKERIEEFQRQQRGPASHSKSEHNESVH